VGRERLMARNASKTRLLGYRILAIAVVIGIWQLVAVSGLIDTFYISKPSLVATKLWDMLGQSDVQDGLKVTSEEVLLGLLIGCGSGILIGLGLGALPLLFDITSPIITTVYTLPRLALLPLFVLWFGIGEASKVALIVSLVFFSMLLNTYSGMRGIDRHLVDAVKLMGGRRRDVLRQVILPSITPWLVAGARISLVFAVTGAVVGEMMVSEAGLGYVLTQRSNAFDTTGVLAILVIVAIIANLLNAIFSWIELRATRWSRANAGGQDEAGENETTRLALIESDRVAA
jgi:NitT/TauT family transport system permease protein